MNEETNKWPYNLPASPEYLHADQRGSVSGQLLVNDWYINKDAFQQKVHILDLPTLKMLDPGKVILRETALGQIIFEAIRNGPPLWEIGFPDRSAAEFLIPDPLPGFENHLYTNDTVHKPQFEFAGNSRPLMLGIRVEFVLVSGDFMGEWVETPKYWKWRSFTKVTIPVAIRRNSSYDELIASVMQSGDLDCASGDVVISYLMHSRKKVNPTIINSDVRVLMYMMDVDAYGFRPLLRINVVERSFKGPVNSLEPPPPRPTVDDDFNNYKNDDDDPINTEDDCMPMGDVSSDSQDDDEDCGTGSQPRYFFIDEITFISIKHSPTRKSSKCC
ncbi:hypothetical protein BC332_29657 [Capsicum chinense]|nr:hypothetical protein BC332_29657 [Capsicum chinense]